MTFFKKHRLVAAVLAQSLMPIGGLFSQTTNTEEEIIDAYRTYASIPREVIYLHTNKTDFLIGEQLGFKAYVTDKRTGMPSGNTTNLYVQLVDEQNKTYKEQLIQVEKGVAYGTFLMDSTLTKKNYILKAFTNWSLNFKKPSFFERIIRIVDKDSVVGLGSYELKDSELTVAFETAGGHLIANTLNSLGLRVRDRNGFGVPNLECRLVDENGNELKHFELNEKGLAKILLTPKKGLKFKLYVTKDSTIQVFDLPEVRESGISVIVVDRKDKILLNFTTNRDFLPQAKNQRYRLALHNGSNLKLIPLSSFKSTAIAHNIPKSMLFPGMNIFTVLDETNTPVLERMYFNHQKENKTIIESFVSRVGNDSIHIRLLFKNLKEKVDVSISILPEGSEASNAHQNITSFKLLQTHFNKGTENAADYFTEKSDFEKNLDILLLMQGNSVYDWTNITNFPSKLRYDFEKGIKVVLVKKRMKNENYVALPHKGNELRYMQPFPLENSFSVDSLFPYQTDKFKISEVKADGRFIKPILKNALNFFPSKIPKVQLSQDLFYYKPISKEVITPLGEEWNMLLPMKDNIIALDEVVVSENRVNDQRLKNLQDFTFGKVIVFDDDMRKRFPDIITFLQMQNGVSITTKMDSITTNIAHVYLDGVTIKSPVLRNNDLSLLLGLSTQDIDYVEVNRFGVGEGIRGYGGALKIFTRSDYTNPAKKRFQYLDVPYPLTFSKPKKYVTPLYSSYTNETYEKYGVVAWLPDLKLNSDGVVNFTIPASTLSDIELDIQGMTTNGGLISEKLVLPLYD